MYVIDICRVFLYTDLMTTLKRQIQLKIKKFDELMIKLKIKYNESNPVNNLDNVYGDLHKLDENIQEVSKLVDNNKQ